MQKLRQKYERAGFTTVFSGEFHCRNFIAKAFKQILETLYN